MLENISAAHGPRFPLVSSSARSTRRSTGAEGLIEIADWESAEAQAAAVEQGAPAGFYVPVVRARCGSVQGHPYWLAALRLRVQTGTSREGTWERWRWRHHRAGQGRRLGGVRRSARRGTQGRVRGTWLRRGITDHQPWLQKNPDGSSLIIVVIDGPGAELLIGPVRDLRRRVRQVAHGEGRRGPRDRLQRPAAAARERKICLGKPRRRRALACTRSDERNVRVRQPSVSIERRRLSPFENGTYRAFSSRQMRALHRARRAVVPGVSGPGRRAPVSP